MNVFVLCTGRCGSVTFAEACHHITNFSAAHESRSSLIGNDRLAYPPNHIEADNRLSWVLGRLDKAYGDNAAYVHLRRDDRRTAESFLNRSRQGIIKAYCEGILVYRNQGEVTVDECLDYCDTVNSNIEMFLRNKSKAMEFRLENAQEDFKKFWTFIGAEGNLDAALEAWKVPHNPSKARLPSGIFFGALRRLKRGISRLA